MSNKEDLKKQSLLNSQQTALNNEATADRAAWRAPNPLDEAAQAESLGYFKFLQDPSHDWTKLPALAYSGMFEDRAAAGEEQRTALGASRFGASAVDPNLQAVISATLKDRRVQRRGESLERAVSGYDAKMRGQASDVSARDAAKKAGLAGLTTGASSNATNSYASFTPRPAWGLTLATSALGAAGSIFSGIGARPGAAPPRPVPPPSIVSGRPLLP